MLNKATWNCNSLTAEVIHKIHAKFKSVAEKKSQKGAKSDKSETTLNDVKLNHIIFSPIDLYYIVKKYILLNTNQI